jgi:hypothetical protein
MAQALEESAEALISSLEYEKAILNELLRKLGLDEETGEEA